MKEGLGKEVLAGGSSADTSRGTDIPFGTKVRTLYQHSETATVERPRKQNLPKPGPDWFLIRFDSGGALYIHRDMLAVANS